MTEGRPPGFAPDDPQDGRKLGQWRTRYPEPEARKAIKLEAAYLIGVAALWIVMTLTLFTGTLADLLSIPSSLNQSFLTYMAGILGGLLGGTLISIKWLYHTVARELWNADRWLWRVFTPFLSAGVSFGFLLLVSSEILAIFRSEALDSPTTAMGIGFIVGLFSDSAIAKLKELADTLFGMTERGT